MFYLLAGDHACNRLGILPTTRENRASPICRRIRHIDPTGVRLRTEPHTYDLVQGNELGLLQSIQLRPVIQ